MTSTASYAYLTGPPNFLQLLRKRELATYWELYDIEQGLRQLVIEMGIGISQAEKSNNRQQLPFRGVTIPSDGIDGERNPGAVRSAFNENYYMLIPRVDVGWDSGDSWCYSDSLAQPDYVYVHFDVRGNMSLGPLQQVKASSLNGKLPVLTSYDQNTSRRVSGILTFHIPHDRWCKHAQFENCWLGAGAELNFEPLESGYLMVDLMVLAEADARRKLWARGREKARQEFDAFMLKKQEEEAEQMEILVRFDGGPEEHVNVYPEANIYAAMQHAHPDSADAIIVDEVLHGGQPLEPGDTFDGLGIEYGARLSVTLTDGRAKQAAELAEMDRAMPARDDIANGFKAVGW